MVTRQQHASVFEQALREHQVLENKLAHLSELLEKRDVPMSEIAKVLEGLRAFFLVHFQHEESDGFFDAIVAQAPQLSRLADKLVHEHFMLLERLDGLLKFARRGTGQPLCWRTLNLRLEDFIKLLHQHESEENGMLQMAYGDDLGTKD